MDGCPCVLLVSYKTAEATWLLIIQQATKRASHLQERMHTVIWICVAACMCYAQMHSQLLYTYVRLLTNDQLSRQFK